jgi:hypothetical protein
MTANSPVFGTDALIKKSGRSKLRVYDTEWKRYHTIKGIFSNFLFYLLMENGKI